MSYLLSWQLANTVLGPLSVYLLIRLFRSGVKVRQRRRRLRSHVLNFVAVVAISLVAGSVNVFFVPEGTSGVGTGTHGWLGIGFGVFIILTGVFNGKRFKFHYLLAAFTLILGILNSVSGVIVAWT